VANDEIAHLRGLMELPTLEAIFSELAVERDSNAVARQMVGLIDG
jgi:ABC-2 type transport system ATP-binding protein